MVVLSEIKKLFKTEKRIDKQTNEQINKETHQAKPNETEPISSKCLN